MHATEASVDRFCEIVYIAIVNYVSYVAHDVNIFRLITSLASGNHDWARRDSIANEDLRPVKGGKLLAF